LTGSSGWMNRAAIFGYDFFISFTLGPAPRGTQSYASDLARQLRERDYTVFFSEDEAPPGAVLDATLRRALRRSRILLVVANSDALCASKWVREEVTEFRARHPKRSIIPINVGTALEDCRADTESWLSFEQTIWVNETTDAVQSGIASAAVVERLAVTPRSIKTNTRMRWAVAATMLVLSSLTLLAWSNSREAQAQRDVAISRQLAAQSLSESERNWSRSILLALAASRIGRSAETRSALLASVLGLQRQVTFLWGHTRAVRAVVFSPNGTLLASAGEDGRIIFSDVVSHRQLGASLDAGSKVVSLAFSPDGALLVSGGNSGVIFWDVATRARLSAPSGVISSGVAFRPGGEIVVSAQGDGSLLFFNVASRTPLGPAIAAHDGPAFSVAFHPGGNILASGGNDGDVLLWDVARQRRTALKGHSGEIVSLAFSEDGRYLASGSNEETVVVWDVEAAAPVGTPLSGLDGIVMGLAFSPDGRQLAASSYGNRLLVWDVETRELVAEPLGRHERDGVSSVAYSPDGRLIASGGGDGTVILCDMGVHPLADRLDADGEDVSSVAFSPDGRAIAAGTGGNTVLLWETAARQRRALRGHRNSVSSVSFGRDAALLASGDADGTVLMWDVQSGRQVGEPLLAHSGPVTARFSADGQWLATGGGDGHVVIWDVKTRTRSGPAMTVPHGTVLALAFSPDGRFLASGGSGRSVAVWDLERRRIAGEPLTTVAEGVQRLAFTADGRLLTAATSDRIVNIWDVESRHAVPPIVLKRSSAMSVVFSPDGSLAALGSGRLVGGRAENKIVLVDVAAREPLGELQQTCPIFDLAFSPDSALLATASGCDGVTLWHADEASWRHSACAAVNRTLTREEWRELVGADIPYVPVCPK
jgi:WD40 repeat protein